MIEGFDKEIDAILRKARDGESVISNNSHLDADEIAAFAENALPEKSKPLYMKHLAECNRCRRILSNIILLNAEADTVPAFVADKHEIVAVSVPWYRRFFVFPNLAYSLGALVLIFGGLIAFTVLQSPKMSDVSQLNDKPYESKSTSAANTLNNTAANMTNVPTNSNAASSYSSNSTANTAPNSAVANSNPSAIQPNILPSVKPKMPVKEENYSCQDCGSGGEDDVVKQPTNNDADKSVTLSKPNSVILKDSTDEPLKTEDRKQDSETKNDEDSYGSRTENKPKPALKKQLPNSSATGGTSRAGGKTFNRRNNVWYDSEYNNQPTTNITRGTNEYKNLDKDLRQTVERLGGTVVIVWKSKAYKIQ